MMLLATLAWWYAAGWAGLAGRIGRRIDRVMESFSITLLLGSLFDPFRQIDAGHTAGGSFDAQLRAFGNRLFSRLFGAVIRTLFICIGIFLAVVTAIVGLLQLAVWPLVPFLPIVGVALAAVGATL
jgi:hypothetical protein